MAAIRHFLLIGESGNQRIQNGDRIEVIDAYQRSEMQIALAYNLCVNGEEIQLGIPPSYIRKLNTTGPVDGEIVHVSRIGKHLLIAVSLGRKDFLPLVS
ncbi:MAG: hypothetical protein ACSLFH_00215 [Desulfuromonadales bacterium]